MKRFVEESGTAAVLALIDRESSLATATIAYAELYAGLARKRREGYLSQDNYAKLSAHLEGEWPSYNRVELQKEILDLARELIERHPLRGFDAIHLASALSLKTRLEQDVLFLASDVKLLRAASDERLKTLNVELAR